MRNPFIIVLIMFLLSNAAGAAIISEEEYQTGFRTLLKAIDGKEKPRCRMH
jgi:hypothetical protein